MSNRIRLWAVVGAIVILLVVILVYPYESNGLPEWRFRVVDEKGLPVAGVQVFQEWQYRLDEGQTFIDSKSTDKEGMVIFPKRTIRGTLVWRTLSSSVLRADGWSTRAYVCAEKQRGDESWDGPTQRPASQMVLHPSSCRLD
jgi:hypothetical protein